MHAILICSLAIQFHFLYCCIISINQLFCSIITQQRITVVSTELYYHSNHISMAIESYYQEHPYEPSLQAIRQIISSSRVSSHLMYIFHLSFHPSRHMPENKSYICSLFHYQFIPHIYLQHTLLLFRSVCKNSWLQFSLHAPFSMAY